MPYCQASGCRNVTGRNLKQTFHPLPNPTKDPELFKKWVAAIQVEKFVSPNYEYSRQHVICSDHFTESDFVDDMRARLTGFKPRVRVFLSEDAVPSVFNRASDDKTQNLQKKEPPKMAADAGSMAKVEAREYLRSVLEESKAPAASVADQQPSSPSLEFPQAQSSAIAANHLRSVLEKQKASASTKSDQPSSSSLDGPQPQPSASAQNKDRSLAVMERVLQKKAIGRPRLDISNSARKEMKMKRDREYRKRIKRLGVDEDIYHRWLALSKQLAVAPRDLARILLDLAEETDLLHLVAKSKQRGSGCVPGSRGSDPDAHPSEETMPSGSEPEPDQDPDPDPDPDPEMSNPSHFRPTRPSNPVVSRQSDDRVSAASSSNASRKGSWMTKEEMRTAVTLYLRNESQGDQGDSEKGQSSSRAPSVSKRKAGSPGEQVASKHVYRSGSSGISHSTGSSATDGTSFSVSNRTQMFNGNPVVGAPDWPYPAPQTCNRPGVSSPDDHLQERSAETLQPSAHLQTHLNPAWHDYTCTCKKTGDGFREACRCMFVVGENIIKEEPASDHEGTRMEGVNAGWHHGGIEGAVTGVRVKEEPVSD